MRYTYTLFVEGTRKDITTRIEEVYLALNKLNPSLSWKVNVHDNATTKQCFSTRNTNDLEEWYEGACRAAQWSDLESKTALRAMIEHNMNQQWEPFNERETEIHMQEKITPIADAVSKETPVGTSRLTLGKLTMKAEKDHINPSHYQGYCQDLQWLEAMQYLPHFRDPKAFLAAVELQVRKYLDRSGGKGKELQETEKALWYLKFMTAYMKNGYKPVRVADIDGILTGK